MSNSMPVGHAREQLQELISILRELRNAGPRDQSFKQWRQVTLTLLQRIWSGDSTRATIFRRIVFSAPTARANAAATREYFERGCTEASAYLEGLSLELETGVALKTPPSVAPVDAPAPASREEDREESREELPAPPLKFRPTRPAEPARPPEPAAGEPVAIEPLAPRVAPPPPAERSPAPSFLTPAASGSPGVSEPPPSASSWSQVTPTANAPGRPRTRLKDMLGFSDDAAPSRTPFAPAPPPLAVTPRPTPEPVVEREGEQRPYEPAAAPGPEVDDATADDGVPEHASTAAEPEIRASRPAPTLAAREVLSMAGLVAELGVPAQRRAIVRAALIDLGRQMDSPPVHWAAIRQALAFMLDYPQIARRVLPLILPYIEEAA